MKIRSVHPEFFSDAKIAQLPLVARLFYIGLWCVADDYGRGRLHLKTLEGQVFPHDIVDIQQLVYELEKRGFIHSYEIDDERYFVIPKWDDWQKPRYQAVSKIPAPTDDSTDSATVSQDSGRLWREPARLSEKKAVGEGEGAGGGTAREEDFQLFHNLRSMKLATLKKANNPTSMARFLSNQPDVIEESKRIYGHRDCGKCGGKGFTEAYSPGAGTVKTECEEDTQ